MWAAHAAASRRGLRTKTPWLAKSLASCSPGGTADIVGGVTQRNHQICQVSNKRVIREKSIGINLNPN